MPDNTIDATPPAETPEPQQPPEAATGDTETPDNTESMPADLGDAGRKILGEERRRTKAAEKTITALRREIEGLTKKVKGFEDRDKTEDQKRAEALDAAKAETAAAREEAAKAGLELLRHRVASRKGLGDWVEYLHGGSEEELEEAADRLLERIGDQAKPRKPQPDPKLGRGEGGSPSTAEQFASTLGQLL